MAYLYLSEQGAYLGISENKFEVKDGDITQGNLREYFFRKWSEMISDHFFSESNFLAKFHGAIDSKTSFGM